jgi:hypothetical protein
MILLNLADYFCMLFVQETAKNSHYAIFTPIDFKKGLQLVSDMGN